MTLGQRVAVLRDGVLQQVDTPRRLYHHPANAFVAAFIGSPSINFAMAALDGERVRFAGFDVRLPDGLRPPVRDGEPVLLGIRPDALRDARSAPPDAASVEVQVAVREDLGHESLLFFPVAEPPQERAAIRRATFEPEQGEQLIGEEGRTLFCARVAAGFEAPAGGTARLALAPEALWFFDPVTGVALPRGDARP
ncbi:MAG: hypothetical protein ACTHOE_03145 [Conexibacter sp.]